MKIPGIILLAVLIEFCIPSYAKTHQKNDYCGDGVIVQGHYYNPNYGYAIELPKSLIGCRPAAPSPNHGVAIPLGSNRTIFVDGSFDSAEPPSLDADIKSMLENEDPAKITITELVWDKTRSFSVKWQSKDRINFMLETLAPLSNAPVLYSVHLITDAAHEVQDIKIFDQVVSSFHKTKQP